MGKPGAFQTLASALRRFLGSPTPRRQAAALPWRWSDGGRIEIMLVTTRASGRWALPKGWPKWGEPLSETAARECFEEAGLTGEVSGDPVGRYGAGKGDASGAARREVTVYPLKVEQVAKDWPERGQRRRAWVPQAKAAARVKDPALLAIIAGFVPPAP